MYYPVRKLIIEIFEGVHRRVEEVEAPAWEDVEAAIKRLNGGSTTNVFLEIDEENHLTVAGGPDAMIAEITRPGDTFLLAVGQEDDTRPFAVVAGGQWSEFPTWSRLALPEVIEIARAYHADGSANPRFEWRG